MKKRFLSLGMAAITAMSSVLPALAVSGDGQSVPVELTIENPTFSVTIPTGLPVAVDADGNVYCSTKASIKNNTHGQVRVSNVSIEGSAPWSVAAWDLDMQKEKVNTSKIALQLNGGNTTSAGYDFQEVNFPVMNGHESMLLTYDAKLPAQTKVISGETVSNVVFTVGWNTGDSNPVSYDIVPVQDVIGEDGIAHVNVGDSIDLTAIGVYGAGESFWSCEQSDILQITKNTEDQAILKVVGPGYATVTYTNQGSTGELQFEAKAPLRGISLDHQSLTLNKGNSSDLHVSYDPTNTTDPKAVEWSSNPSNIVSVVDGHLIAENWGEAIITAKVGNYTAQCIVTVPQVLSGITLSEHNISIKKGSQYTLTANTQYRESPVWSVIEGNCVTVDQGTITAKAPGTAKIQVQLGEFKDICTVNVTPNFPHSTNAPIDKKMMGLQLSDLTGTITFSREKAPSSGTVPINPDGSVVAKISGQNATVYSRDGGGVAAPADSSRLFNKRSSSNYSDGWKASNYDFDGLDTSNVTSMSRMFYFAEVPTLDLSNFDTRNLTNMMQMVAFSSATILDLSSFDTSKVTDISGMFSGAKAKTVYCRTQEDMTKIKSAGGSAKEFIVGHP